MIDAPICPYCNTPSQLGDSARIYNGRSFGKMWICVNWPKCDAYVGCHPGTYKPLGRLADAPLRAFKKAAHGYFDPLWKNAPSLYDLPANEFDRKKAIRCIKAKARTRAYAWLAERLGLHGHNTHIGMFDVDECKRVIEVCKDVTPNTIREWAKEREPA